MAKKQTSTNKVTKKQKQQKNSKIDFLYKYKMFIAIGLFAFIGSIFIYSSFAASSIKPVTPNSRFAWLLQGTPNPAIMDSESGPKVYDFDYLNSSAAQIAQIKAKGITAICYFSAGTDEDWRPDHNQFISGDTFGQLPGWEGELIVDTRSANVRQIMYNRIQTMSNLGCDGIEPDNIDAYTNSNSIPLNEATTLDYMQFLTDTAHSFNMSVALKNGGDLVNKKLPNGKTVVQAHDFVIVEQCYEYQECDAYAPFVAANKAVFIVEYKGTASSWAASASCKDANTKNYDAYLMNLNLNGPRTACRTSGGTTVTPPSNSPPAVGITSPANNQSFASGVSIPFSANASDSDGSIKQVQFYVGSSSFGIDTTAPYSTNVTGLAPGTYTLSAVATDNTSANNNTATGSVTIVVVAPTEPVPTANALPVVNLQTPPSTLGAPANFALSAGASDSDGTITKIEFYSGANKIGEDTSSPYAFAVTNYSAGSYVFTAKATDNAGAVATSKAATVIVTSTPTTPTTPPSTTTPPAPVPTTGSTPIWPANAKMTKGFDTSWWKNNCAFKTTCGIYVHWPKATDDVRVAGYEVWRKKDSGNYVKLYVNSASDRYYSDRIDKTSVYTYQVFAVDNDGNRSAGPTRSVQLTCALMVCSL